MSSCSTSRQVSDLLREQLLLRSEISDDGGDTPSRHSSRSPSLQRGEDGEHRGGGGGTYRASINITPATPPRPNAHAEEREEDEERNKEQGEREAGAGVGPSEFGGAVGGAKMDNLQQLIKQVIGGTPQEVLGSEVEKSFWTHACKVNREL